MSFRRRITLVSAAAVAVAVILASVLTYLLTSHQLSNQVDSQLRDRAAGLHYAANSTSAGLPRLLGAGKRRDLPRALARGADPRLFAKPSGGTNPFGKVPPRPNQVRGYQQLVDSHGKVLFRSGSPTVTLPVDARTRGLAAHGGHSFFTDATVKGIHLRILSEPLRSGYAVQFAQPLTDDDHVLARLRLILALLDVGGIALAALLGRLVTGAAVRPVKRLTQATEHIALTQDLSGRIPTGSEDEIGRLAVSFNAMLEALERSMSALDASVHAQRQLVADASHELRTPVTSLRTNIEILQQVTDMNPEDRARLLTDVVEQIEELTLLMNDLIDLARGDDPGEAPEDVRLDVLVEEAVQRARRHAPTTRFETHLAPLVLAGIPARLGRAINNLIDNAVKYSPEGEPVQITLTDRELSVRDHGPGIGEDDLPHIFDRFYRGAEARGRSGSGLGLAIVRQVAEQHHGSISAEAAPGGGTLMRLRLPGAEPVTEDRSSTANGDGDASARNLVGEIP